MRRVLTAVVAASAAVLAACSDSSPNTGKLTVQMTDAPFPFAQVSTVDIFVVRVDARTASPTED